MSLHIGILAGEPSGDLLGAGLMRALKAKDADIRFTGIGGSRMLAEGLEPLFGIDRLGVNGFVEPIRRLPDLLHILRALVRHYRRSRADLFIGVDFNVFNLRLERSLKRCGIPTVHYVSPSVYAWRRGRIKRIGRAVDRLLALYPFEPPLYHERRVDAVFIGHPLADEIAPEAPGPVRERARRALGLPSDATVVALLPGSRMSEIELMGELMLETAARFAEHRPQARFLVPCPSPRIEAAMAARLADGSGATACEGLDVRLLPGDAREALAAADVALVKSGTGTLEAMLLATPMVVTYRLGRLSYHVVAALKRSRFVALPNILAGRALVPELLQDEARPEALAEALLGEMRRAQADPGYLAEFRRLHGELRRGADARAAEAVLELLRR